jgi:hypothetical protein
LNEAAARKSVLGMSVWKELFTPQSEKTECSCSLDFPHLQSWRVPRRWKNAMSFQVVPLSDRQFSHLFSLSDVELRARRARRVRVDSTPGFPDRLTLDDAELGSEVILTNYTHLESDGPFHACHAIYVSQQPSILYPVDTMPPALARRLLSLRAFDAEHNLIAAEVCEGAAAHEAIEQLLSHEARHCSVSYLHAHYARMGCYAAKIVRA